MKAAAKKVPAKKAAKKKLTALNPEKLPGAVRVPADEVDKHLSEIPRDRAVITYCT